jgi:hypothetical protein
MTCVDSRRRNNGLKGVASQSENRELYSAVDDILNRGRHLDDHIWKERNHVWAVGSAIFNILALNSGQVISPGDFSTRSAAETGQSRMGASLPRRFAACKSLNIGGRLSRPVPQPVPREMAVLIFAENFCPAETHGTRKFFRV